MACAAFWISSQTATKQDIDRTKGEGSLTGRSGAEAYAENFGDGTQSNDLDDLADGSHLRDARIRRGLSVAVSERQRNGRWAQPCRHQPGHRCRRGSAGHWNWRVGTFPAAADIPGIELLFYY
jgi:hypothetical protein